MGKVLLVEDDADTRLLLRLVLEGARHVVIEATNGKEALRLVVDAHPECVLVDVGLPDLDGWAVVAAIRALDPQRRIGIVALTGYGDETALSRSHDVGVDEHLVKPVPPATIVATVARLMLRRAPER